MVLSRNVGIISSLARIRTPLAVLPLSNEPYKLLFSFGNDPKHKCPSYLLKWRSISQMNVNNYNAKVTNIPLATVKVSLIIYRKTLPGLLGLVMDHTNHGMWGVAHTSRLNAARDCRCRYFRFYLKPLFTYSLVIVTLLITCTFWHTVTVVRGPLCTPKQNAHSDYTKKWDAAR